ncbi:MAG: 1-acyl-sn-glycerol-3-phosphate acyltransferase [Prevotella sp.]|nr:1-acyl-sn-glycerol-3-phosphate acyltransferase [Prevotella sp.]
MKALDVYQDIRPYETGEMRQAFEDLLADRQFNLILKSFAPWLPRWASHGILRLMFRGVKTPLDFQKRFMKPVVRYIIKKKTDGISFDETALPRDKSLRYTFVSNHRDIVLDSAFLDILLVDKDYPTTVEIGIGDNLLIYPWIKRLVRMNKAFVVRRGLTPHEMMESSMLMSQYIHHAVNDKKENIWIAQREGRAKDSDDRTQDSVLKMLAMGGEGNMAEKIADLNIVPLAISYEFDPCDYLKAKEFQQKRDNPRHKKSKQDDLDNMKTGIFGYKGRVHYCCARPLNEYMAGLDVTAMTKNDFFRTMASRIDDDIHSRYRLYPSNYVALDMLSGNDDHAAHYTAKDKARFEEYIATQLAKIEIENKDEDFLRERMLIMYANPARNFIRVTQDKQ